MAIQKGDRVRIVNYPSYTGRFGSVTGVPGDGRTRGSGYYAVTVDGTTAALLFVAGELELVEPEPAFQVGDRVELAGVTGTVSSHGSICVAVKWDDGHIATFDTAGDILKQLKKLPPEQVFVTGAWYKSKALRTSRFLLTPAGWYQFSGDDLGFVAGPIENIGSFQEHLVEVDFPL